MRNTANNICLSESQLDTSLKIISQVPSLFIHILFFSVAKSHSTLHMNHVFIIHSSAVWHLSIALLLWQEHQWNGWANASIVRCSWGLYLALSFSSVLFHSLRPPSCDFSALLSSLLWWTDVFPISSYNKPILREMISVRKSATVTQM